MRTSKQSQQNPLVSLIDVSKSLAGKRVIDSVSLSIYENQCVGLVGPNGSGKSTLLRLICGLMSIDSGTRETSIGQSDVGYVPDRFPILRFTPKEYLMAMGALQGMLASTLKVRVEQLLVSFSMVSAANERMTGFSKGMLQKVNLMQGILSEPKLLVLDEPLSGLDHDSQQELTSLLASLRDKGMTLIIVSHEPALLTTISNRIFKVESGKVSEDTLMTNRLEQKTNVVEAKFSDNQDQKAIEHHPGIIGIETNDGTFSLLINADATNDVLRLLLEMDADIRSLNQVE